MQKTIIYGLAILAGALVLTGCEALVSPEQAAAMREAWAQQLADGAITQSEHDGLVGLLETAASQTPLSKWTDIGISVGGAVLLAFFGIELRRGSPNKRKGLPPQPA